MLIYYTEYFISTAPEKHFEIAFRLFDLNGDGEVSYEEFQQVMILLCSVSKGKNVYKVYHNDWYLSVSRVKWSD